MRFTLSVLALCVAGLAASAEAQWGYQPYRYQAPYQYRAPGAGNYTFQQMGGTTFGNGPQGSYTIQRYGNNYSGYGPGYGNFSGGNIGNYSYGRGRYGSYSGWSW